MLGIVLAVVAAVSWGCSGLLGAVSARRVGGVAAALWTYPFGIVLLAPLAAITGIPAEADLRGVAIGAGSGLVAVIALALAFRAGAEGHAGLASSMVALEGVFAALIAAVIGSQALRPLALLLLVPVAAGILLLGRTDGGGLRLGKATVLGLASGVGFGISIVGFAAAAESLGAVGQTFLVRVVGSVVVAGLALLGRLPSPRGALVPIAAVAVSESTGNIAYLVAADRVGVAVSAVIASQFALVTLVLGWLALGERLTRRQAAGAALVLAGVALFTAVQT